MNTEQNKALARDLLKAYDEGRMDDMMAMHSPNAITHMSGQDNSNDAMREVLGMFQTAIPDGSHTD